MKKLSMEELERLSVEEFKETKKSPIALVLDNVRSLNNVGSAFRTGDAFRVEKIYLCGITGTPPHRDIQKTALGATESVEWEYCLNTMEAVHKLKAEGYQLCALEQVDQSILLNEFKPEPNKKYALIFGNEVFGVEEEVLKACNQVLEIPQLGTKHSLNISVSLGIAVWDLMVKLEAFDS
ncbi:MULTISPECIES: RNA methyltransferase [Algoriphagus]|jgi:tRNA G18 (ribose-2'-O)-methylase SpoU|uniref:RNA methyltransferase n=1 Tax=Algoriphagus TaxID=246875 RepID=UPI000C52B035|nr:MULTISPECIES: RNA methyltransferase [Algoriphagus]MAL12128.1 RNA methyltransferase [Algoriphagus sp.]MAN87022.1 RNA methyltransferase [Algoriphagus sp.]QYH40479.1 RNA methyltransferase [Algoriphagus sp. NBT04N3]HAS59661.1 RNA methyltransferase [Algoriphagus sp.]HCH43672.1 RNA methyltransferase [Algoriphagus sp.]|tara:strand:+ start:878 stop:1417 length:540 start_codon:yes stop_codon:yes gene_type:complete